jgi:hypothetical protein
MQLLSIRFIVTLILSLRVPIRYIRDFSMFILCPSIKYCPAQCTSSAIVAGKAFYIFEIKAASLNHFLFIDLLKVSHFLLHTFLFIIWLLRMNLTYFY